MLEFKNLSINDIKNYYQYANLTKEFSCENSFVNLLIWQTAYNNMIAFEDGAVFIKSATEKPYFYLPFCDDLEKGVEKIFQYCNGQKPTFFLSDGPAFEEFKAKFGNDFTITELGDGTDYIYLRENLAELKGKKYHAKRNHINAFSKKYDWRYEPITQENTEKIKICAKNWYEERAENPDRIISYEEDGLEIILSNMDALNVKGGAILVEDKVVAFALGSPINDEVYNIHIEKALLEFGESYAVINREFAKNELGDYKYINREDDMGIEGLRKAKLSYYPEILLKKYIAR